MEYCIYKCKRCETGFRGEEIPEGYAQIRDVLLGDISKPPYLALFVLPHLCDDGGMGIAEFIGRASGELPPILTRTP